MRWNRNQSRFNVVILVCLFLLTTLFLIFQPISVSCIVPQRLPERTLVLDAGHGGEDGGAVSVTGQPESGINLAIVLKLEQLCGFFGVNAVLTRSKDCSLKDENTVTLAEMKRTDLCNRVKRINQQENPLLISIHQNFYFGSKSSGAQVFYAPTEESDELALHCQQIFTQSVDRSNHRQAKKISSDIYLMNHVACPAILIECGFLSNREEAEKLETDTYQITLAAAIVSAYLTF